MKDYAIIFNPTSANGRSRKRFRLMESTLSHLGVAYDLFETEHFGHAIQLAEQAAKDGYRVIAAGGDGTCNEVLNGIIISKTNALLGFIPMGTGNDIPAAVGYRPKDVKRACEVIAEDHQGSADIGLSINATEEKRYFLGIGSQGFDAAVTKRTNEGKKWLPGTWNYIASVVKTVFKFKRREVRVKLDDQVWEGKCNMVAVSNGPSYGGMIYICPRARVDDGRFHLTIANMNSLELLYKFNSMYSKTLQPDSHIMEFSSKNVEISMKNAEDETYFGQVDGEIIGNLPISYQTLKDGYTFIKPKINEATVAFMEKHGKKFKKHLQKLQKSNLAYWKTIDYKL